MSDLSLYQFAQIAGSNSVGGMARAVGLKWPPPPAISLRDLIKNVGSSFYVTQHYDNGRVGWNPFENKLTISAVQNGFKLLFSQQVDDLVQAQPLYVRNVSVPGQGNHNIVFVAAVNGSIFAFDADAAVAPLWHKQLISVPGEIPHQLSVNGQDRNYGLVSTPVINPSSGVLYAVCATQTKESPIQFNHRLHALSITSGEDLPGSPVEIEGTFKGSEIQFSSEIQMNRPGLLLHGGRIYIAFGSYGDDRRAHGWVLSYDPISLNRVGAFCTSSDPSSTPPPLASIWQSGIGLSADSDGYVYFATGNGDFNADTTNGGNYGNSVVKLRRDMTVADYFTPCNQANLSVSQIDQDLGSGNAMVVPFQNGLHQKLVLACGKEGTIYVIDRTNMGKGKSAQPTPDPNVICDDPSPPLVDRQVRAVGGAPTTQIQRDALFGGPTYFVDNSGTQRCYYCGSFPLDPAPPTPQPDHLKAFRMDTATGKLAPPQFSEQSSDLFGGEGGSIPVISSNGSSDGIVWQLDRATSTFGLVAFDATNLRSRLVKLSLAPPPISPFHVPTVMNGKVYVATNTTLSVFGLV